MLTKQDISTLKTIFVTKEEFHSGLKTNSDSLWKEIRQEMRNNTETIVSEIKDIFELIGTYIEKTEKVEKEIADHHIILSTHETRLRKLE